MHSSDISSDTSGSVDNESGILTHPMSTLDLHNGTHDPEYTRDYSTLHAKRGHVMRELIDTERVYVTELAEVLEVSRISFGTTFTLNVWTIPR